MAPPKMRFAVKRLRWDENWDGERTRVPGEVTVATFATAEEAEQDRRRREHAARKGVNPFTCGTALHYQTHLAEPLLRDWLMDHGVEPPKAKKDANWREWWKRNGKKLPAEKQAAVWDALDKVRFFTVAHEPVRKVAFAIVRVNWEYNDENFSAGIEGGDLTEVYRDRAKAETRLEALNATAAEMWSGEIADMGFDDSELDADDRMPAFDMTQRLAHRAGTSPARARRGLQPGEFADTNGVPFYEIIEVEVEGLE